MLNIEKVEQVYLACGVTDLRKAIDGLSILVTASYKLSPYDNALFVFCNRKRDKLKILHWDNGFWLYYYRLEKDMFKWPDNDNDTVKVDFDEFKWLLKGYEIRHKNKFKSVKQSEHF